MKRLNMPTSNDLCALALWVLPVFGHSCVIAADSGFAGTAYAETRHTSVYVGKGIGPQQHGFQALVDQCNAFRRAHYGLPSVNPPSALLTSLDVYVQEKFLDTDKALTLVKGTGLQLIDMQRWIKEFAISAKAGIAPPVPPDCSAVKSDAKQSGTLWRDGMRYTLRFDTRKANSIAAPLTTMFLMAQADYVALPKSTVMGQTCHNVTGFTMPMLGITGAPCVWDRFAFVGYLNWPFSLAGYLQTSFGGDTVIETLAVETDKAISPTVFAIPAGFALITSR